MNWYLTIRTKLSSSDKTANGPIYGYWITPEGKRIEVQNPQTSKGLTITHGYVAARNGFTDVEDAIANGWIHVNCQIEPVIETWQKPTPAQVNQLEVIFDQTTWPYVNYHYMNQPPKAIKRQELYSVLTKGDIARNPGDTHPILHTQNPALDKLLWKNRQSE